MDQIIIGARNIYGVVVQDGCRAKGSVTPQYNNGGETTSYPMPLVAISTIRETTTLLQTKHVTSIHYEHLTVSSHLVAWMINGKRYDVAVYFAALYSFCCSREEALANRSLQQFFVTAMFVPMKMSINVDRINSTISLLLGFLPGNRVV